MSGPRLSLSLRELLIVVSIAAALLLTCRWLRFEPLVGAVSSLYLTGLLILLLLLGRGQ